MDNKALETLPVIVLKNIINDVCILILNKKNNNQL